MAGAILNVEFLETNKGGRQLISNCYTYLRTTKETHASLGNALAMCTRDDEPTKLGNVHNHLPDRAVVEGRKILRAIRFRAKTELKPIPSIYDEEICKWMPRPGK